MEYRQLPVRMTPDEAAVKANTLAEKVKERNDLEAKKAAVARDMGDDIKKLATEIAHLAYEVREGTEYREVPCDDSPDYRRGVVDTVRTDTGEVVASRPMTIDERQTALPLESIEGGKRRSKAAKEAESEVG